MEAYKVSANWKKLQAQLKHHNQQQQQSPSEKVVQGSRKRKRAVEGSSKPDGKKVKYDSSRKFPPATTTAGARSSKKMSEQSSTVSTPSATVATADETTKVNAGLSEGVQIGKYLAIDCEMVGVSSWGTSALARVSIVNYNGEQVYDSYVVPKEPVCDWRTHVSGIRPEHMAIARPFDEVRQTVANIVRGRILIGHSIEYDLHALDLNHPRRDIRDTAYHLSYRDLVGGSTPSLRLLADEILGIDIQSGEHSSVEDAQATMLLFKQDQAAFERANARNYPPPPPPPPVPAVAEGQPEKTKKKKKKKKNKKKGSR